MCAIRKRQRDGPWVLENGDSIGFEFEAIDSGRQVLKGWIDPLASAFTKSNGQSRRSWLTLSFNHFDVPFGETPESQSVARSMTVGCFGW